MKTKFTYCVLMGMIYASDCYSQLGPNLIANWSFEQIRPDVNGDTICFGCSGCIYMAEHWNSAYGSVDYFNACSNEDWPKFGVPNNMYGFQEAFDGVAYAHLASYAEPWDDAREFLVIELPDTLPRGKGYFLQFKVSLADSVNFAVSNVGALVSVENTRFQPLPYFFNTEPQIESPDGILLDDKEDWLTISGQFVAEGGERFLTIGTFKPDSEIVVQRVSNYPAIIYSWEACSYFIDAVELREDNSIGIGEPEKYTIELYPNPASELVNIKVNDGEQIELQIKDQLGRALLSQRSLQKEHTINVASLHAGVYQLEVVLKDGLVVRRRFIKE